MNSTTNTDPMADIMQADERIDALPEIGVMDLFVRGKMAKALMEHYGQLPDGFGHPSFEKGEEALTHHSMDGIRAWAGMEAFGGAFSRKVADIAADTRSEDFIVEMFGLLTRDDWADERKVEAAREWLKRHLQGSLGMPDDRVIRENLDEYVDVHGDRVKYNWLDE